MGLRDIMQRDAAALTRASGLGETLEFRPRGSAADAVYVSADVARLGIITDDDSELAFKVVQVFLPPVGVENGPPRAPVPGDVLVVAFDEGADPVPGRIRTLLSQDAGGFTLEVIK
jgi:hypothetical protein